MDPAVLDRMLRAGERCRALRLVPAAGERVILRVDGKGFSRLTEARFEKPFDRRFHQLMQSVARALLLELQGVYAHVASDEVSLLLGPGPLPYSGRVEKLVSVAAGVASATFSAEAGFPAAFDARVWCGAEDQVSDYFRWRQGDTRRCALGGWCYWTLRRAGTSATAAGARLERLSASGQRSLLAEHGIEVDELPSWQTRGAGVFLREEPREGFDPVRGEVVLTTRRVVAVDEELPAGEAYRSFVRAKM